jgi:sterol desaturase/sphingolipid hydroxylase (fatty acid hydroxylase superfamily)
VLGDGGVKRALSVVLWPALVGGAMLAARALIARGMSPTLALVALQAVVIAVVAALERWMPEHAAWNVARNDLRTDALHALVSGILVAALLRQLVFAAVPSLALWPARWPVPLQLGLALFVADFGSYGTHVITHHVAWLWPIHSPHHSARRLYWLNAQRMHPLDTASTLACSLAPLALLGAPPSVLALFDAFAVVHLTLQHSNVRLRHGPLSHLFATAEFHRWHHSSDRAGGESNYASFLSLWDHLCGTFRMPRAAQRPDEVGLYDGSSVPDGWRDQVRLPFRYWLTRRAARRTA